MRVAGMIRDTLVNGEGVRDVIFLQGCEHHCEGCHNPDTWDRKGGKEIDEFGLVVYLSESKNDITLSGGEPILQYANVLRFLDKLTEYTDKRVWMYTGFTFEAVPMPMWKTLAHYHVDVVIDGKFEQDKKDSTLKYRGSSNQRIIDLQKSVETGYVVLWEGC